MTEWLAVMLEEIRRKQEQRRSERGEHERRVANDRKRKRPAGDDGSPGAGGQPDDR